MRQVIKHRDIRLLNMIRRTDPVIPLSISYRIGELSASVKKAERSISNDDVKGGGSGGSSGSSE